MGGGRQNPAGAIVKRAFDIVVALFLLMVLSPVLIASALAVALTSPGPALYIQSRVGRNRQLFRVWKFRSMVANADQVGGYSTASGDPRITRIGRILRKTSIDELPQLWNVLRGDMSLVGPRPLTPMQESTFSPEAWAKRHQVRPGITGLAQAKLRSSATPEQRTALDLEYVDRHTLSLDLQILGMTVKQILFRRAGN